ncbi:hypothetical protein JKP88DRAFT_265307 [Tribonema minus]|uniref:AAA+ ATPase domain-containing protein n=1 Tax=Tribonema minus TaxID=303371 RepID=A0A836C8V0_9STRA|nr:hypothetical protein JKP88DRAFT_265307 [Tribonema minus]
MADFMLLQCSSSRPRTGVSLTTSGMFDREHERARLDRLIKDEPRSLIVVVGPPSSGKSYLFRNTLRRQRICGPMCYINCRDLAATSPEVLAAHVATLGLPSFTIGDPRFTTSLPKTLTKPLLRFATSFKGSVPLPGDATNEATAKAALKILEDRAAAPKADVPLDLSTVLKVYGEMTAAWERRRKRGGLRVAKKLPWPVLVIDEANKLEKWGEKHQEALDALISFFIMITKEVHRCHVFLVTSECGFEAWLQQQPGVRDIFCSTYVVGHFEEKDAKDFLELELQASLKNSGNKSTVVVSNADWRQIYEVCGGNAGLLKLAAGDFGVQYPNGSWRSVLEELCSATYGKVQDAALQGGDDFNSVHYIDAALALLNSAHNAITQHAMELLLGSRNKTAVHLGTEAQAQAGERVLRAIMKANRLGLRSYSALANDIPREAYGPKLAFRLP